MRQLVGVVRAQPQHVGGDAVLDVPVVRALAPVLVPLLASSGGTKYSISICSNSRVRNTKFPGVISLRNDLPTWAMPNGGFFRDVSSTFLKLMNMPCAVSGRRYTSWPAPSTGPGVGLEHQVELACLGEAVLASRSSGRCRGRRACRAGSAPCSSLQSTSGSVKFARWPDASHTAGGLRIAASRPTTSSRSCTIERHQAFFTLRSISTPSGPVVVGRPEAAVDLGRREHEAAPLAEVDDLVEQRRIGRGGHGRPGYRPVPPTDHEMQ